MLNATGPPHQRMMRGCSLDKQKSYVKACTCGPDVTHIAITTIGLVIWNV